MTEQQYDINDTIQLEKGDLQCVSVGYQETDGVKHDFVYQFRLASDVLAEKEAAEKADAELRAASERPTTEEE